MSNLFHVIVCAVVMNAENEILLCRRKAEKKLGGFWEFPGGKLEPGEELHDALRRELREELQIEIANIRLLSVKPHQYPHGNVLLLFYLCSHESGTLTPIDHDRIEWLTVKELASHDNLLPANTEVIETLTRMPSF